MAQGQAPVLCIQPRVSKWLLAWLLGTHSLAAGGALALSASHRAGWFVLPAIGVSLLFHWRRYYLRIDRHAVLEACRLPDGMWRIDTPSAKKVEAALRPGGLVHPWCMALQFIGRDKRRYRLLLARDSIDIDLARRLRVLLRKPEAMTRDDHSGGT